MKPTQQQKDNKLIAEFMEWDILNDMTYSKATKGKWIELDKLKFHSNWNWLMEVVEKIESLNYSIEINKQEENDYQCLVVQKDIKVQTFSKIKIEAVYNACVEFIKFYNEQAK